ncbi:hypothetical protein B0A49_03583 [Cryomyces minteri]|uniref:FAS1 domain-containing protein n=1 Tax=Cryomyces minteri TaxID=331657 RepID=A0A4U0X5Y5_9PEZI|nr:hypothetical protein B0A49_03583 [Cryomyces minteri]
MWPLFALGLSSLISSASAQQLSLKDTLASHANLTSFYNLVSNNTEIYNALTSSAGFTLLAPSDEAMARIPYTSLNTAFANADNDTIRAVLQYHVLRGTHPVSELTSDFEFVPTWLNNPAHSNVTGGQRVGLVQQAGDVIIVTSGMGTRSTVVDRDIQTTNCLVHVVDNLLIPPTNFSTSFPQFNLTPVLNAARDMTVFAPTNLAMQLIGTGLQNLSAAALAATMGLHVLNGTVLYSSGFRNGSVLGMGVGAAAGSNGPATATANATGTGTEAGTANATLSFLSNAWYVNAAKVVQQDLLLANGVMHVLDNVLDPNNTSQLPNPSLPTQAPLIPGSTVPYVPFTAYLPCSGASCPTSASASASSTATTTGTVASASGAASASARATTSSKAAAATAPPRVGTGLLAAALALGIVA